jgi:hypothetical protein
VKAEAAETGYPPRGKPWLSAVVVFVVAAIATADQMAISMLIGPIKREFAIGDFQASLLVGLALQLVTSGSMAITVVLLLVLRPRLATYVLQRKGSAK